MEGIPGSVEETSKSGSQRVTIREVAKAAGVSVGTVSLALSGHPSVAGTTREKVQQAAARLHYSPSAVGRALQSQRTNSVGLIVPHSSQHVFGHLYFMEVLAGVSEALSSAGMTLVLSTAPSETDEGAAYARIMRSQLIDGVILASAALHDKNIASLQLSPHPFVFVGRYPLDPNVPSVSVDDTGGARQGVRHLIEHGHKRIAHISGPLAHLSAADRLEGYKQELQDAGLEFTPEYLFEGDYSAESGRTGMQSFLSLDEPPTALFAANDETAIGAIDALKDAGIMPGERFPVVGFDDVLLSRVITPPLTTVHQPMRQLGTESTQLLLTLLQGRMPGQLQTQLPTELVVRGSCGCATSRTSQNRGGDA